MTIFFKPQMTSQDISKCAIFSDHIPGAILMRLLCLLLTFLGFFYQPLCAEENFILIHGSTQEIIKEFGSSIHVQVAPACSFNIALSLMGYDAGVLKDEHTPNWSYQDGYDDFSESWKQPQTPQTWMTRSCVWFSKILSIELRLKAIEHYLSLFGYGNQDFSKGIIPPGPINPAWVSASLKISPMEQVEFVQKMVQQKLPISSHALEKTKNILFKEEFSTGLKLFGKKGLVEVIDEKGTLLKVRWFVGWVENTHNFYPFAYLLQQQEVDILQTVPRVKQLLEESNLTGYDSL